MTSEYLNFDPIAIDNIGGWCYNKLSLSLEHCRFLFNYALLEPVVLRGNLFF